MVVELILPAIGVLAISAAVGAVVYHFSNKQVTDALTQIHESQDERDDRIRKAIKETLSNDLDKIKAEGIKVKDTIDDSVKLMKKLQVERNEFKKEVADLLRMQLKQELGSRLRDSMARLTQVSEEQNKLEQLIDNSKKDVRGGIIQITDRVSSIKEDVKRIKRELNSITSNKKDLEENIINSLNDREIKDINDKFDAAVKDLKSSQDLNKLKKFNESVLKDNRKLKSDFSSLKKQNTKLLREMDKLKKKLANKPRSKASRSKSKKK